MSPEDLLKYELLVKTNFNAQKAQQCYDFLKRKAEHKAADTIEEVEIDSMLDGIYVVKNNNEYIPFSSGQTLSEDEAAA